MVWLVFMAGIALDACRGVKEVDHSHGIFFATGAPSPDEVYLCISWSALLVKHFEIRTRYKRSSLVSPCRMSVGIHIYAPRHASI